MTFSCYQEDVFVCCSEFWDIVRNARLHMIKRWGGGRVVKNKVVSISTSLSRKLVTWNRILKLHSIIMQKHKEIILVPFDYDAAPRKEVGQRKSRFFRFAIDYYAKTCRNHTSLVWLRFGFKMSVLLAVSRRESGGARPQHHNYALIPPSRPCRKHLSVCAHVITQHSFQ